MTATSLPPPALHRPETFWVQALSGTGLIGWGAYVALFAPLDDLPVYDLLSRYVPDEAWSGISTGLGLAQLGAALASQRWPYRTRVARGITAFLALVLWKVVAVSMFNSGHAGPMAMVACVIALFNIPVVVLLLRRA